MSLDFKQIMTGTTKCYDPLSATNNMKITVVYIICNLIVENDMA